MGTGNSPQAMSQLATALVNSTQIYFQFTACDIANFPPSQNRGIKPALLTGNT